jgi:hypothetical protein
MAFAQYVDEAFNMDLVHPVVPSSRKQMRSPLAR